jgi:hypothetical protein
LAVGKRDEYHSTPRYQFFSTVKNVGSLSSDMKICGWRRQVVMKTRRAGLHGADAQEIREHRKYQ